VTWRQSVNQAPLKSRPDILQQAIKAAMLAGCVCAWGTAGASSVSSLLEPSRQMVAGASGVSSFSMSPLAAVLFSGMDLGRWQDATRRAMTPDFAEGLGFRLELDFGLMSDYQHLMLPGFVETMEAERGANQLTVDFYSGRMVDTPLVSDFSSRLLAQGGVPSAGIERQLFAPGLQQRLGNGGNLNVAAVFAQQSYATLGLGSAAYDREYLLPGETAAGAGVRLGISGELAPGIEIGAAFQSRIDMDSFENYRGVYSDPGDFDIPASANIGLVVRASRNASLSFDVQRVLYSEVNSFTSNLLPDRFLSLLGDSSSPSFNWDDLTVYRVGWNWQSSEEFSWQLQYSTSQQPAPTSEALVQALSPEFADNNMSFGFSKRTGRNARINFAASYAPSEYLLGNNAFGRQSDLNDDLFEFEVMWIWDF
jgi:hypothetical protein